MKTDSYQRRFYRDWIDSLGLFRTQITEKESDLFILTDKKPDENLLRERLINYRLQIEKYITRDQNFLTSLKPIPVELNAPSIVKAMADASYKAEVGPMAAVAGAIAEFLGRDLLKEGFKEVIVENGGDIFMKIETQRKVKIYAGKNKAWQKLKIKIKPELSPLGICTSSGTIGHSLSFGSAESVVVLAESAILADAVATATCNRVNSYEDMHKALIFARRIKGILGAIIIFREKLLAWGNFEFV